MQKVISFVANIRAVGTIGPSQIELIHDLEKALKDGYSVVNFNQTIATYNERDVALMTFVLEKKD